MSRCEKCSFYKDDKGSEKAACEFASFMSYVDEAKTDMEFPCDDVEYQEYLSKKALDDKYAVVELAS